MCAASCNGTWYMMDEIEQGWEMNWWMLRDFEDLSCWEQGRMRGWTGSATRWTELEGLWILWEEGPEESSSPTLDGLHVLMQTLIRTYCYKKQWNKMLQAMEHKTI